MSEERSAAMSAHQQPAKNHVCPHCRSVYRAALLRCSLDGSVLQPFTSDPLEGTPFADRYIIEKCIGIGGMGRVYRAKHRNVSRRFAIKVLFGDLAADRTMRARFAREAEAASRLDHPNVASVVDFGTTEAGLLYLVMDYVAGRSLTEILFKEAPLPPQRAIDLARQLSLGLEHAHDLGLIHRDFKPDNVIVSVRNGKEVPRIVDFGIALVEGLDEERSRLTSSGIFVGTPATIAPEQASGDPVDHRVDLYSLGITLYHMLTGRRPFEGGVIDVLHKHILSPPPAMSEVAPDAGVPSDLEGLCMRLLAKRPDDRPDNAGLVARQLEQLALDPTSLTTVVDESATDAAITVDMEALRADEVTELSTGAPNQFEDDDATDASAQPFHAPARAHAHAPDPFVTLGTAPPPPVQYTAAAVIPMRRRPMDSRLVWAITAVLAALVGLGVGLFIYSDDDATTRKGERGPTSEPPPEVPAMPQAAPAAASVPEPSPAPVAAAEPDAGADAAVPKATTPPVPAPVTDPDAGTGAPAESNDDKRDRKAERRRRKSGNTPSPPSTEEFLALYREVGALIPKVRAAKGATAAAAIETPYKGISPNTALRSESQRTAAVKKLRRLRRRARKAIP